MQRPIVETKEVIVPSGYKITLKAKKSYGDDADIRDKALGDVEIDSDQKLTVAQANALVMATLVNMIVAWDITEEDSTNTPVTEENIKAVFTEEDVDALTSQIGVAKKKL